jgi:hypothetical protein
MPLNKKHFPLHPWLPMNTDAVRTFVGACGHEVTFPADTFVQDTVRVSCVRRATTVH